MKHRFAIGCLSLAALLLAGPAFAANPDPMFWGVTETPSQGLLKSGLLDLSRLEVSNSLSFVTTSTSHGRYSGGLWLTRFGYRVSNPLRVAVDVGAVLNTSGDGPFFNEKSLFLRGFEVNYRPGRAFQLHIAYQYLPANATPGLFDYGWGARPWGSPLGSVR